MSNDEVMNEWLKRTGNKFENPPKVDDNVEEKGSNTEFVNVEL